MTRTIMISISGIYLAIMIYMTTIASLDQNVWDAATALWADLWGRATLVDAYMAFSWGYLIIAIKETQWSSRIVWACAVLFLGSMALSLYVLIHYIRAPKNETIQEFFRR